MGRPRSHDWGVGGYGVRRGRSRESIADIDLDLDSWGGCRRFEVRRRFAGERRVPEAATWIVALEGGIRFNAAVLAASEIAGPGASMVVSSSRRALRARALFAWLATLLPRNSRMSIAGREPRSWIESGGSGVSNDAIQGAIVRLCRFVK